MNGVLIAKGGRDGFGDAPGGDPGDRPNADPS